MTDTNLHHTVILGQEYRFQIKGCELECHQRTHGADAAWYPTADPLMLRHLRTVAEDGDRQVLRTRKTADLLRELEQNQTHVDMLKRRNAWIAVELRARAEAEEEIDDQIDAILAISPPGETIDSVIELVAARLRSKMLAAVPK